MKKYSSCIEAWEDAVKNLPTKGTPYLDQDASKCFELTNEMIVIEDASDSYNLVQSLRRTLVWAYPTPDELKAAIFSYGMGVYEYSVAERLFGGINQLDEFIIPLLKKAPSTRRAVVTAYEPTKDSKIQSVNVPVIVSLNFRLHKDDSGKQTTLHLTAFIRSCDAFLGLPANLYQLRLLQEYVARSLGENPGPLTILFSSLHWFEKYNEIAAPTLSKTLKQASLGRQNKN